MYKSLPFGVGFIFLHFFKLFLRKVLTIYAK
nr:MAG TPA: hypothetical protein [Caudoviricetes sp.]